MHHGGRSFMNYHHNGFNNGRRSWSTVSSPTPRCNSAPQFSTNRHRPLYRPSFRRGSCRPNYDSSFWYNYKPLIAEKEEENAEQPAAIKAINLNAYENRREHYTSNYGLPNLIVRRGQPFEINVDLNTAFDMNNDVIKIQVTIGDKPIQSKGTVVRFPVSNDSRQPLKTDQWGARIDKMTDGNRSIAITINPSVDAIVGEYQLFVEAYQTDDSGKVQMKRHKAKESFYLLFNPWCSDDAVYLPNQAEREEYVLNEIGRQYVGSSKQIRGRQWNYGQFSKYVLKCAVHLLNISYLSKMAQSNPTQVTRCLSAMANNNDNDNGILEGNWSGKYHGGTSPSAWNGSVAIIQEYMAHKKAVKYGQCWVFSAITTSLCRALGIPTRSVTNFDSAHDRDFSMSIDFHVDTQGRPTKVLDDSVWNFHVWNESWFKRFDLPPGNDGWQAFDATPQEASEGIMRCGPAPVRAIKEGNVFYGYDCKFLFAEVNGDRVRWEVDDEKGEMTPISTQANSVGACISTKAVGSNERHDLTGDYKHPEGSVEEREAVSRASNYSSRSSKLIDIYRTNISQDVECSYTGTCSQNGDIVACLEMKNTSNEKRSVNVHMYAMARYYTGLTGEEVSEKHFEVELDAEENKRLEWSIEGSVYLSKIDEDAKLSVFVSAKVNETGQHFSDEDYYMVDIPDLQVDCEKTRVKVGEEFDVVVSYRNCLNTRMTECALYVEAAGIQKHKKLQIDRYTLRPGEQFRKHVKLTAKYPGKREVIFNLYSKQMVGITGSVSVEVVE